MSNSSRFFEVEEDFFDALGLLDLVVGAQFAHCLRNHSFLWTQLSARLFFRHDLHHFSFVVFHLWAHERGFPSKSGGSRSDTIDIDGPGVLKKNVTPSSWGQKIEFSNSCGFFDLIGSCYSHWLGELNAPIRLKKPHVVREIPGGARGRFFI